MLLNRFYDGELPTTDDTKLPNSNLPLSDRTRRELVAFLTPIRVIDEDGDIFTENTINRHKEFPHIGDFQKKMGWDVPR